LSERADAEAARGSFEKTRRIGVGGDSGRPVGTEGRRVEKSVESGAGKESRK
jgi:hypothetical protein